MNRVANLEAGVLDRDRDSVIGARRPEREEVAARL